MGFGRSFPMGWGTLRRVGHLLISLKLAVILLLAILVVAFLSTLFPQLPPGVAADPDTQSLWLALAQEKYGLLFSPLHTLGLFNLFRSLWFRLLLSLLIINVTICTINRIRSTWRVAFKPKVRVSDALFQKGTLQASLVANSPTGGGGSGAEDALAPRLSLIDREGGRCALHSR